MMDLSKVIAVSMVAAAAKQPLEAEVSKRFITGTARRYRGVLSSSGNGDEARKQLRRLRAMNHFHWRLTACFARSLKVEASRREVTLRAILGRQCTTGKV